MKKLVFIAIVAGLFAFLPVGEAQTMLDGTEFTGFVLPEIQGEVTKEQCFTVDLPMEGTCSVQAQVNGSGLFGRQPYYLGLGLTEDGDPVEESAAQAVCELFELTALPGVEVMKTDSCSASFLVAPRVVPAGERELCLTVAGLYDIGGYVWENLSEENGTGGGANLVAYTASIEVRCAANSN